MKCQISSLFAAVVVYDCSRERNPGNIFDHKLYTTF